MIAFEDVGVILQGRQVLHDVSLQLTERRIAVIGANGSGKSTLARLTNGLLVPNTGTVRVDGISTSADADAVRSRVGFVFQNPDNQIVFPSVAEDMAFGLKNMGLDAETRARKVTEALETYGLSHLAERATYHLSGGEKQMIALLGVLIMAPTYIVLDEPTTLLDRRNARALARRLADLPQSLIVVTHDLELIADFDRAICLHEGRVLADGAPGEVIAAYKALDP